MVWGLDGWRRGTLLPDNRGHHALEQLGGGPCGEDDHGDGAADLEPVLACHGAAGASKYARKRTTAS